MVLVCLVSVIGSPFAASSVALIVPAFPDVYKRQVFEVDNKLYLVNESGKIQTSNRAFRASGEYRYEYDHGTIYYINDNKERIGEVTDGSPLPESAYKEVYTLANSAQ